MLNIKIAWLKMKIKKHYLLISWAIALIATYIFFPFGAIALPICLFMTIKELLKFFAKELTKEKDKP